MIQTEEKERHWTAKRWRTSETGRKMQRNVPPLTPGPTEEYVRYTEKEEPLNENHARRDLHLSELSLSREMGNTLRLYPECIVGVEKGNGLGDSHRLHELFH